MELAGNKALVDHLVKEVTQHVTKSMQQTLSAMQQAISVAIRSEIAASRAVMKSEIKETIRSEVEAAQAASQAATKAANEVMTKTIINSINESLSGASSSRSSLLSEDGLVFCSGKNQDGSACKRRGAYCNSHSSSSSPRPGLAMKRCSGKTKRGQQCKRDTNDESGHCKTHRDLQNTASPAEQVCISHVQHDDRRSRVSEDAPMNTLGAALDKMMSLRRKTSEDVKHMPRASEDAPMNTLGAALDKMMSLRRKTSEDVKHLPRASEDEPPRQDQRSRVSEDAPMNTLGAALDKMMSLRRKTSEDEPLGQDRRSHVSEGKLASPSEPHRDVRGRNQGVSEENPHDCSETAESLAGARSSSLAGARSSILQTDEFIGPHEMMKALTGKVTIASIDRKLADKHKESDWRYRQMMASAGRVVTEPTADLAPVRLSVNDLQDSKFVAAGINFGRGNIGKVPQRCIAVQSEFMGGTRLIHFGDHDNLEQKHLDTRYDLYIHERLVSKRVRLQDYIEDIKRIGSVYKHQDRR